MLGLILISAATFFQEVSSSIAKREIKLKEETVYTMGFLSNIWITLAFILIAFARPDSFVLSSESFPILIVRLILELVVMHAFFLGVVKADRSTFGFLRILTLPLLLVADIVLGYQVSTSQMLGIVVIFVALIFLFLNHGIKKRGARYVLLTAIGAVATISMYKYNITHYNSVVAEQLLAHLVLLLYFMFLSMHVKHEHPLKKLKKPILFIQSVAASAGSMLGSFAFLYAPASVITSAKRSSAILWSIVSGKKVFHEKHVLLKLVGFVILSVGIVLLAF